MKNIFMVNYKTIKTEQIKVRAVNTEDAIEKVLDAVDSNGYDFHVWRIEDGYEPNKQKV